MMYIIVFPQSQWTTELQVDVEGLIIVVVCEKVTNIYSISN